MPTLFRDYETRSLVDLRKVGAVRYAADATTEVLCCAYAVDDGPVKLWIPGQPIPREFHRAATGRDWIVAAFVDQFEAAIERHNLAPRLGWPVVPLTRHRCHWAVALAHALPSSLRGVAKALSLEHPKQDDRIMLRMCKPRRARKGEDTNRVHWADTPELREKLHAYCGADVACERDLARRLRPLPRREERIRQISEIINRRGFKIDRPIVGAAGRIVKAALADKMRASRN